MWLKLQHVFCSYLGGKSNKHHAHKTRCLREYLSGILLIFSGNSERQRIGFLFSFKNITLKKHRFLNLSFYRTPTLPVHLWPRPLQSVCLSHPTCPNKGVPNAKGQARRSAFGLERQTQRCPRARKALPI